MKTRKYVHTEKAALFLKELIRPPEESTAGHHKVNSQVLYLSQDLAANGSSDLLAAFSMHL